MIEPAAQRQFVQVRTRSVVVRIEEAGLWCCVAVAPWPTSAALLDPRHRLVIHARRRCNGMVHGRADGPNTGLSVLSVVGDERGGPIVDGRKVSDRLTDSKGVVDQAATVYRWRRTGYLPATRLGHGRGSVRILVTDFEARS